MNAQHTPGPWKSTHWNQCGSIDVAAGLAGNGFRLNDEPKGAVARIYPREQAPDVERGPSNVAECEANALLIAAAPDLLEACRAALGNLSERCETRKRWTCGDQDAYETLAAAIAKVQP